VNGNALGHAYVEGRGRGTVFATDSKHFFTIQIDRTGERMHVHRSRVRWAK
jgi:hypothetical protein